MQNTPRCRHSPQQLISVLPDNNVTVYTMLYIAYAAAALADCAATLLS
jgi:hypothetical protein